jgi:hypothetical protein
MKKLIILSIIITAMLTGCATRMVLVPAVPAQPAVTNAVTGVITPPVPSVAAVVTNVPNQTITTISSYGNQVLPFVPAPWNAVAGGILSLLTIGAGAAAAYKNKQLNTANAVTATVVSGVEAAGTLADAVKTAISKQALADGTADAVHAAVQANTTVPLPPPPIK